MKKKLYRSMCAVACGTIFLTALVSLLVCYGLIETQIKETIRNECYLVAAGLNDTADEEAYFEELAKPLPETGRYGSRIACHGPFCGNGDFRPISSRRKAHALL